MDCAKGTVVAGLYDEVMVEILSRVPVKDLRRSTCVSKPWRDLITDPLNRKKLPQTLEGFFHGSADGRRSYGHFTSLLGSGECSVPPVDPSFSFLTAKLPGFVYMVLLDSCNGLLLFGCTREDKFGYIVCNPATEELVTVPAISASCPPLPPREMRCFFGVIDDQEERFANTILIFDPAVSSHFHLVQIWENASMKEVETVHSYSSQTRAWTDRSSKWKSGENGGEWGLWGKSVFRRRCGKALVDGLLHFVVFNVEKFEHLIVAVDGEGKTCRIIGLHDKPGSVLNTFIGQSQGHLHCISMDTQSSHMLYFSHPHFSHLSVWVLEDCDTQTWILKHNVSTSQLFGLLSCPVDDFDIVAIHPDHNSIIFIQGSNKKLVLYDMDSKELRALRTLGKGRLCLTPYVPCFRFTVPRIHGDTKAERIDTKATKVAPSTSSDMIRNLDVKAAKQTKKSDYSSQVPAMLQLKDIPFISAPDLQNSSTMANQFPYDPRSTLPFLRMPYLNYSSSLSSESSESLRDANELLKQEVQKLQAEVKSLRHEREQQDTELQKSEAKAHEAMNLATEEASKLKTAKDVIKSLTAQLKEMSERLPPGACDFKNGRLMGALAPEMGRENQFRYDQNNIQYPQTHSSVASARFGGLPAQIHQASDYNETVMVPQENRGEHLNGIREFSPVQQSANGGVIGYRQRPDDHDRRETDRFQINLQNLNMRSSSSPNNQVDAEWIEQYEPGVYLTLVSLRDGTKELKRVRFSRRRFGEHQAESWWNDNREKVYEKYNVCGTDRLSSVTMA